jgi:hypothetical protein
MADPYSRYCTKGRSQKVPPYWSYSPKRWGPKSVTSQSATRQSLKKGTRKSFSFCLEAPHLPLLYAKPGKAKQAGAKQEAAE